MTEYHDKMNKWEYLSEIRFKFSERILESKPEEFYKLVYSELKQIIGQEVVLILADSITYNQHIAITDETINMTTPWHQWFDDFAGKKEENTPNLRNLIWENKNSTELNTEKEVADTLLYQDSKVKSIPIKSWFSTPIIWGENENAKVVGSIIVYSKNKENKNKKLYDKIFIAHFARHLAILFKNKRIFDRDKALVISARELYFNPKNASTFDEVVRNVLEKAYEYAKKLMNVNDFLAFVVPEKHIKISSEPKLYLSYKRGDKTENKRREIFYEIARYIIEHPQEKILLKNKMDVTNKLSVICPNFHHEDFPKTLVVVPMSLGSNEARGAFILYHMGHKNAYDEDDRSVIDRLSDQAALAIDQAHSQQLKRKTHRERHNALFKMNKVLFELDNSHVSESDAIKEVLKISLEHIDKIGINIENVSICTLPDENDINLTEKDAPVLQLNYKEGKNNLDLGIEPYIEEAMLRVINNPTETILFSNKEDFNNSNLKLTNVKSIPESFLAVPMRLEEKLARGAFVFYGDSEDLYTKNDLDFIDDISDSVALVIKNILGRIAKEKILFGMSRKLLGLVKHIGGKSNDEIIETILATSYEFSSKLAKADNMMIYMKSDSDENVLELKKFYKNKQEIITSNIESPISIKLVQYVIDNPEKPILWKNEQHAEILLKKRNLEIESPLPKSLLIVPMSLDVEDSAKGAFILYDFDIENKYENAEKDFLDEVSDQVAVIIQNILLNHAKQDLEHSNTSLIKQLEISKQLEIGKQLETQKNKKSEELKTFTQELLLLPSVNLSEEDLVNKIYKLAAKLMDVNNMYIARCDASKEKIRFPLFYLNGKKKAIEERDFSNGRTEWIIENQKPILIDTKENSIKWYIDNEFESVTEDPLASWLGVPISIKNKQFGIIATFHPEKENLYDKTDLENLQYLANQIAGAFENSRLYEKEQELNKTISESEHALTRLLIANDLIHRLNNAAGTIPIWVNLIDKEAVKNNPSSKNIIKYNKEIAVNINNLLGVVEKIKYPEIDSEIDINAILDEHTKHIQLKFYNEIQNKNLKINSSIDVLCKTYGSLSNISNAIFNILSNGIDSILEKGHGELTISAKNISDENIKIKIEDTGIGISDKNCKKIFTPYFTTKKNGTGYGLWRTKFIIEKMGGNISVKSQENIGSVFIIIIPINKKAEKNG